MLAGKFEGTITNEDIQELLGGLLSNVSHADDWDLWVDGDNWNDAKVHAALEEIKRRVLAFDRMAKRLADSDEPTRATKKPGQGA